MHSGCNSWMWNILTYAMHIHSYLFNLTFLLARFYIRCGVYVQSDLERTKNKVPLVSAQVFALSLNLILCFRFYFLCTRYLLSVHEDSRALRVSSSNVGEDETFQKHGQS